MKPLERWKLSRVTIVRAGMLVAVTTVIAACKRPAADSAGAGSSTGASATVQTAGAVAPTPSEPPTPTLKKLGFPDEPGKLTSQQLNDYIALLKFDGGSAGDNAECPANSCAPGAPRARVRIEPERGSHAITESEFKEGWRIVAIISLLDPAKPHNKWNLKDEETRAVWWVGPDANKNLISMVTTGADVVVPPHALCIKKDVPPKTSQARWYKNHSPPCENIRTSSDSAAAKSLAASQPPGIRTFHETWFACAAGCCGMIEMK